jgi:hypothetical protein
MKAIIISVAAVLILAACTGNLWRQSGKDSSVKVVGEQTSEMKNSPALLSVLDPGTGVIHRLRVETIVLKLDQISGYSETTERLEIFLLNPADNEFFSQMKKKKGLEATEVSCIQCHQARDNKFYLRQD